VRLAGAGPADQHGVALLGEESAAGQIAHQGLIDRGTVELEVVEVLGEYSHLFSLFRRIWSAPTPSTEDGKARLYWVEIRRMSAIN